MTDPVLRELVEIQRLQHTDVDAATARMLAWLREQCPLPVEEVTLRPKPTALNSVSGVALVDGRRLFFKSHVDPDGAVAEYYNSAALTDAGYDVVRPVFAERRAGRQVIFYPLIEDPVMFDLVRGVERFGDAGGAALVEAERAECRRLASVYERTAVPLDAAAHAAAPVHQLFWHRLTGGRFDAFYGRATFGGVEFADLAGRRWTVNGVAQPRSLGALLAEARTVLDPRRPAVGIVGHGDAHYGNVFLTPDGFRYFDPAFAGRHAAVLDAAKPLFHNVFAEWMYFPAEAAARASVSVELGAGSVGIEYADAFSDLRRALLDAKREALVGPLLARVPAPERRALQLALVCCALLTMNTADTARYPAPVGWLALALAVQLGNGDEEQDFGFGGGVRMVP